MRRKLIGSTLVLAAILAAALTWYPRAKPARAASGQAPATVRAERRNLRFNIEVTGDVNPAQQVEIKPEVSGRIIRLPVLAGQTVKKGDTLVELDDRDLLTERQGALTDIERAKLTVDRTQADFDRGKGLYRAKLSSQETFDNVSNDLALAKNALAKAQRTLQSVDDRLTKTRILSPTDGTILVLPVVEGQVVTAAASVNSGTSLMTVANLSNLIVVLQVNQVDVAKLAVGQKVTLGLDALREPPMTASIRFIAPVAAVKNAIKGFQVEATIERPSARLRPGMTVNLTVPIDHADNALSVPVATVFGEDNGDKFVYVRGRKRPVTIGVTDYFYTQILTGLTDGEEVQLTAPGRARS